MLLNRHQKSDYWINDASRITGAVRSFVRLNSLLITLFLSIGCTGCSVSEIGLQSVQEDIHVGATFAGQIRDQMGIVQNAELTQYLDDLTMRLSQHLPDQRFKYHIEIVDQAEPNAFALPGGYIFVSRGLLAIANSEDELAGTLAHEMTHVYRRHTARQLAKARLASPLKLPGKVVGHVISDELGQILSMPRNIFGGAFQKAFSRADELEADKGALETCSRAGFNTHDLGNILSRMSPQEELVTGVRRRASFFDTHPMTPTRVRRIEDFASRSPISHDNNRHQKDTHFQRRMDGLILGENPTNGLFQDGTFVHPRLDYVIDPPLGWLSVNAPNALVSMAPTRDGGMFLGPLTTTETPQQLANRFVTELERATGVTPAENKPIDIGKWKGHVVKLLDESGESPVAAYFLWVTTETTTLHAFALAAERHESTMGDSVRSLRTLTDQDRKRIKVTRLRLVQEKDGENLQQLTARTKNLWTPEMTSLMNDLDSSSTLTSDTWIKIATESSYR